MTQPAPPKGTFHGTLRWFVHRVHDRPTRFGEAPGPLRWAVSTIVQGRGSRGLRIGSPSLFRSRADALTHAHKQATRTYGPREARP